MKLTHINLHVLRWSEICNNKNHWLVSVTMNKSEKGKEIEIIHKGNLSKKYELNLVRKICQWQKKKLSHDLECAENAVTTSICSYRQVFTCTWIAPLCTSYKFINMIVLNENYKICDTTASNTMIRHICLGFTPGSSTK